MRETAHFGGLCRRTPPTCIADSMSADEAHYPREKVYQYTKEFAEKDYEDASA